MEAASCFKTLLGCRAIWDCPEGRLGTVLWWVPRWELGILREVVGS